MIKIIVLACFLVQTIGVVAYPVKSAVHEAYERQQQQDLRAQENNSIFCEQETQEDSIQEDTHDKNWLQKKWQEWSLLKKIAYPAVVIYGFALVCLGFGEKIAPTKKIKEEK